MCVVTLTAQNTNQSVWLQMERGIEEYDRGHLGEALKIFRQIIEQDPSYANAHMWIGHVFAAEGEYEAAIGKYEDSLEIGRNFFPRSEKIEAYYSLAETSMRVGDEERSRYCLKQVFEQGREEVLPATRQIAIVEKFLTEGPDKTLELYRLKDKAVRRAYQIFGELELQSGNYNQALEYFLLSIITSLSLAIDVLRSEDPEYLFIQNEMNPGDPNFHTGNTARLLKDVQDHSDLQAYFESIGLYRQLFFLGAALFGMESPEKAQDIWLLVTDNRAAGIWYDFAQGQLVEPDLQIISTALQYR